MKILAFNGSPRMEKGATDKVLDKFLEGAQSAGAEIEKIYIKRKRIVNCTGCFDCWFKTPGACIFNDDMTEIIQKLNQSDVAAFGTPVYAGTMTSYMSTMFERIIPILEPRSEKFGNRTRPGLRKGSKPLKVVVISVCGFPEREQFEALIPTFKKLAIDFHMEIIGEIYRQDSGTLLAKAPSKAVKEFLEAAFKAGQEVTKHGQISEKTQKRLDKSPFT